LLFGFLILRHDRRELVHVNVTTRQLPGPSNSLSRVSRKRQRPSTCSAIGTRSTVTCSHGV
jgi:hypothetical protein